MSNLLTSLDLHLLAAVTAGASTASPRCTTGSTPDLLQTLNSLSTTLKEVGTAAKGTGFSTTEVLMLGIMMQQQRSNSVVFVHRPFW